MKLKHCFILILQKTSFVYLQKSIENRSNNNNQTASNVEEQPESNVTDESSDNAVITQSTTTEISTNAKEQTTNYKVETTKFRSGQSKKMYLVSTTRNNTHEEGHDQPPIMIHIEEIGSQAEKEGTDKRVVSVTEACAVDNNSTGHQMSDNSQNYQSIAQTIASDPVTAAAVKSILDIGQETLNRANRSSPQAHSSQSCVSTQEDTVITDLDTCKTVRTKSISTVAQSPCDTQSMEGPEEEYTIEVVIDDNIELENGKILSLFFLSIFHC